MQWCVVGNAAMDLFGGDPHKGYDGWICGGSDAFFVGAIMLVWSTVKGGERMMSWLLVSKFLWERKVDVRVYRWVKMCEYEVV